MTSLNHFQEGHSERQLGLEIDSIGHPPYVGRASLPCAELGSLGVATISVSITCGG